MSERLKPRRKPPGWFRWTVLAGMLLAVALPAACVLNHGELPGYQVLPSSLSMMTSP